MKKLFLLLLSMTVCVAASGCSAAKYPYYSMPIYNDSGATVCFAFTPRTAAIIAENSPLIVQGKLSDDAKRVDDEYIKRTASTLTITKVWKGDYKKGDTITLYERYHIEEKDGQKVLKIMLGYMPSEVGKEYLFFLGPIGPFEDVYGPTLYTVGRYPMLSPNARAADVDSMPVEELYLYRDNEHYRELYKEVIAEYMSK